MSSIQQDDIVSFWIKHRALPSETAARQRVSQVCYLITEEDTSEPVGVTTLYPDRIGQPSQPCLMMRMFIAPEHRRSRLPIVGTTATLAYARTHVSTQEFVGVVNVNENSKLARAGLRRKFADVGYRLLGQWRGQDVWFYEFQNITLVDT